MRLWSLEQTVGEMPRRVLRCTLALLYGCREKCFECVTRGALRCVHNTELSSCVPKVGESDIRQHILYTERLTSEQQTTTSKVLGVVHHDEKRITNFRAGYNVLASNMRNRVESVPSPYELSVRTRTTHRFTWGVTSYGIISSVIITIIIIIINPGGGDTYRLIVELKVRKFTL